MARDPDRATRTASNTGGATGDNVGSVQSEGVISHTHGFGSGIGTATEHGNNTPKAGEWVDGTYYVSNYGGNETRPLNAYVQFCIKY